MISRNNANAKKIEAMSPELKDAYLSSATRVTVGKVEQVVKNAEGKNVFKTWYVAKIRGVIVGDQGEYLHETPEAARKYGKNVLEQWRSAFLAKHRDAVVHHFCNRNVKITDMKNGKFVFETNFDESGYVTATGLNDAVEQMKEIFSRNDVQRGNMIDVLKIIQNG